LDRRPTPHTEIRTDRAVLPRRLPWRAPRPRPAFHFRNRHAASLQSWRPLPDVRRHAPAKPTDPWTAVDVAQAARRHVRLQNTVHWIESIAMDREP